MTDAASPSTYRLKFHGTGREYFGIWIVNLLLTIVTVGIYSAWATVRTNRYFCGATELDGSRFGYHAQPKAILIGRLIGAAFFIPYAVLQQFSPIASLCLLLIGLTVLPWLIVRAMRFRMRVLSYRNIRFGFDDSPPAVKLAYRYYLWMPLLLIPTGGLIWPYIQHQHSKYLATRIRYGNTAMGFRSDVGAFYIAYLQLILVEMSIFLAMGIIAIPIAVLYYFLSQQLGFRHLIHSPLFKTGGPILAGICIFLVYLSFIVLVVAFRNWLQRVTYNRITLGDMSVRADYHPWRLFTLYLGNILMLLCTLGFAYPWVKCRTVRYLIDHIELTAPTGLHQFQAGATDDSNAVADQVASIFDVDIGIGV
jgi:uncharacterized membrane protein YjgN (DUF898 family)